MQLYKKKNASSIMIFNIQIPFIITKMFSILSGTFQLIFLITPTIKYPSKKFVNKTFYKALL